MLGSNESVGFHPHHLGSVATLSWLPFQHTWRGAVVTAAPRLQFNPDRRLTVEQTLALPYLEQLHCPEAQQLPRLLTLVAAAEWISGGRNSMECLLDLLDLLDHSGSYWIYYDLLDIL